MIKQVPELDTEQSEYKEPTQEQIDKIATAGLDETPTPASTPDLKDPNRKNAYHFDEIVPTQIQHKARSIIRTFVVSLIGVLAAFATKVGITLPADLADTITATVWGIVTVCAQWLLNTKPVDRFLHKVLPFLAAAPKDKGKENA